MATSELSLRIKFTCGHLLHCSPARCEADIVMRRVATLANPVDRIRRVMLYEADTGTYLFLYTSADDGPCEYDEMYETTAEAEAAAAESFGVKPEDWIGIDEPIPDAQHDWIKPVRLKCDTEGNKLWGEFESIPHTR